MSRCNAYEQVKWSSWCSFVALCGVIFLKAHFNLLMWSDALRIHFRYLWTTLWNLSLADKSLVIETDFKEEEFAADNADRYTYIAAGIGCTVLILIVVSDIVTFPRQISFLMVKFIPSFHIETYGNNCNSQYLSFSILLMSIPQCIISEFPDTLSQYL